MGYKAEIEALILGALRHGSLHGYRIAKAIRHSSKDVLKLGDNQIYPALHRLDADGLVTAQWEHQEGKPSRKIYSLTESGAKRLEEHQRRWQDYAQHFSAVLGTGGANNG